MNKEFLKMQKLAGVITESQYKGRLNEAEEINSLQELSNYLMSRVKEYVNETDMVAGDDLNWDDTNAGISKKELVKDFIGYLQDELGEFNKGGLNENRFKVNPDQIVFKSSPTNPNEMLTQHDDEYLDPNDSESEYFTKADFWKSDISKFDDNNGGIISASKMSNGTWKFTWDSGEVSGFKEGEDFEFN